jgi:hypothetical protein
VHESAVTTVVLKQQFAIQTEKKKECNFKLQKKQQFRGINAERKRGE